MVLRCQIQLPIPHSFSRRVKHAMISMDWKDIAKSRHTGLRLIMRSKSVAGVQISWLWDYEKVTIDSLFTMLRRKSIHVLADGG